MEWCRKKMGSLGEEKRSEASPPIVKCPAACIPKNPSPKRPCNSFWNLRMLVEAEPIVMLSRFESVIQVSTGYLLKSRFKHRGLKPRGPVGLAAMPSMPGDTGPRLTVVLFDVSKIVRLHRYSNMYSSAKIPPWQGEKGERNGRERGGEKEFYSLHERSVLDTATSIAGGNEDVVHTRHRAIMGDEDTITTHTSCASIEEGRLGKVGAIEPVPVLRPDNPVILAYHKQEMPNNNLLAESPYNHTPVSVHSRRPRCNSDAKSRSFPINRGKN